MLQHTKSQVELFEMHSFTMFITVYVFPKKDLLLRACSGRQNLEFWISALLVARQRFNLNARCTCITLSLPHSTNPIIELLPVATNQVSWLVLQVSCPFYLPRHHLVKYVGCPCDNGHHFSECSRAVEKETISKEWIRRTKAHSKILNEQKQSGREDADFNQLW